MIIIVGSGIIGSWIAYTFAKAGEEVYVFEKSQNAGDGISGRNSGVLHSGIYYDSGSLKSKMCFQGYEIAIPFFEENQIPYSLCGKVITTGVSETIQEETEKQETIQKLFENGKSLCIPQIELKSNPKQHWKHILGSTALGVHYTFHLGGEAYAGPNSNWASSKEDYKMQTPRGEYYQSLRKILDCYKEEDLHEGYVGLRPRLFYKSEPIKDFILHQESNWIHLLGIESPGLTSSPAIAKEVVRRLGL